MSRDKWEQMATDIAGLDPAVSDRLLAEHQPERDGLCRSCRWRGQRHLLWPCALWRLADRARAIRGQRGVTNLLARRASVTERRAA